MIKKYLIEKDSLFNKSLILSLFEPREFAFHIEGLSDDDRKSLFSSNKIKISKNEINIKNISTRVVAVYLDESFVIRAVVLTPNDKKYYLFKADPQRPSQLNIHSKYISDNLSLLLSDYEKHCKSKGKNYYDGLGDFNEIKDVDYFENVYQKDVDQHIDRKSDIFKLVFNSNNMFTTDFVDLVEKHRITITNDRALDKNAFTLRSMEKNKNDRCDCLLINSESKDIEYFIFTYKPYFVKHYLLLKNLGNNKFEFIKETTCFNEILLCEGIKDLSYKPASKLATRSFARIRYENFYHEYISFELEEELDERIQNELIAVAIVDTKVSLRDELIREAMTVIAESGMALDIRYTLHGKERMLERIGNMSEQEMLSIIKVAYERGLTSGHFIEKDPIMFKFLQYYQNKKLGKTLRLFKDVLFFFALEPPHDLVTCFPYRSNYEQYVSKGKNIKNKH